MNHGVVASLVLASGLALVPWLTGCASIDEPARPVANLPPDDHPPVSNEPYAGPEAMVQLLKRQRRGTPRSVAVMEVIAPTGGHQLTLDATSIHDGMVHLFLTLETPAPGELTTQALVALHTSFESPDEPFDRARMYVRTVQRGDDPDATAYRLAATAP